ncbi:MAG TPA: NAD(P)H-dependent glycerol-3-phosphate dehydrogenase [Oligoflexia bacterium]|nr:NAD(P)H-dependent glycerol-3-phosphate dehydrogenase [Oligoflexia bacterium]HMP27529.1 NAD(P)H-dependent glycerol-3-phosphate dehydrogenase [Oligoflexia bacterium]
MFKGGLAEPKLTVLALGSWGTALAEHLARAGRDVLGWTKSGEIAETINNHHRNPCYLRECALSPRLIATTDLNEALKRDIIILATPSSALAEFAEIFVVAPGNFIIVSAVKGLEPNSLMTPLQFLKSKGIAENRLAVLSGPSFAVDVAALRPVGVVSASADGRLAEQVGRIFTANFLRAYFSDDPLGVELGGIVKNVIAIAAGVSDALGFGESARAGLVTRGLAEMMRLARCLGAKPLTLCGLSGLGDLSMTVTSDLSRNRQVGLRLGAGEPLDKIIGDLGTVAEGIYSTPLIEKLSFELQVEMPITRQVARLLRGEADPRVMAEELIRRSPKYEFAENF